jgi:hypothetical protein
MKLPFFIGKQIWEAGNVGWSHGASGKAEHRCGRPPGEEEQRRQTLCQRCNRVLGAFTHKVRPTGGRKVRIHTGAHKA